MIVAPETDALPEYGLFEFGQSAGVPHLELWGDYALAEPWYLLVAPVALLLTVLLKGRHAAAASGGLPRAGLPRTLRQNLAFCVPLLRVLAVVCFSLALARPLRTNAQTADASEGVDILLVLDRSSSMQLRDMVDPLGSGPMRIQVVREVAIEFARRRMTDRDYARDAVGILGFARYPELICPFTLDVDALESFAQDLRVVPSDEDGTRIGAALAKGVSILEKSDAKSRVIVLLTDGEENRQPLIAPLEAADYARREGVTVHAILAGKKELTGTRGRMELSSRDLDESEMRAIAARAGGSFYRARDRDELENIYAEIEKLERSPRRSLRTVEAYDLYPPVLLAALLLYALAWLAHTTVFRRTLP